METRWFIGVMVSVGLFLVGHLGVAVWFLSGMSTKVSNLTAAVGQIMTDMRSLADQDKRLAVHEERHNRTEHDVLEVRRELANLARSLPVVK